MQGDVVVFVGPTLPREEAAAIFDAIYLPPADQGAFVRAMRDHRPRALVLIDGAFGKVPAVRHKEILWTLAQGVPVLGAASMGALRAAELAAIGMRGYGSIYRWYALTPLADDDEVAVAMTPPELGARPLSEALINIRLTLRLACRRGIVTPATQLALEDLARATPFVERSHASLLERARSLVPAVPARELDRLAGWWPRNAIDRKRDDAIGLLATLNDNQKLLSGFSPPRFRLTESWAHDLAAAGLWDESIAAVENLAEGA